MSRTTKLLDRLEREDGRRELLHHALLFSRLPRYVLYRLRFFLLSQAFTLTLHAIESVIILRIFSSGALVSALGVQNATLALGHAWWGALELLRQELVRTKPGPEREALLRTWNRRALVVASLAMVGFVLYPIYDHHYQEVVSIFAIYGAACFARLALDAILQVVLASTAPLRRVYRPFTIGIGIELVGFGATYWLIERLGVFAMPIGYAITIVSSRLFGLVFALRAYRDLHGSLPRLGRGPSARPQGEKPQDLFLAAVAGLLSRFGALFVFALGVALAWTRSGEALSDDYEFRALLIFVHFARPLLVNASAWLSPFYRDIVSLRARPLRRALRRFVRALRIVAWLLGGASVLLAWATLFWMTRRPPTWALVPLSLLFFARYELALGQMLHLFTGSYVRPTLAGALVVLALTALPFLGDALGAGGIVAFLGLVMALAVLLVRPRGIRFREVDRGRYSRLGFFDQVLSRPGPTHLVRLRFIASAPAAALRGLEASGAVLRLGQTAFVATNHALSRRDLALGTGGCVASADAVAASDGRAALARARELGWFPEEPGDPIEALVATFRATFPDGHVFDVERGRVEGPPITLDRTERSLIAQAASVATKGQRPRAMRASLAVCAPGGDWAIVFRTLDPDPDAWLAFRRRTAACELALTFAAAS